METSKVEVVLLWPEPRTVKGLQSFLGFSHFYRCFLSNFSTMATPLSDLLKGKKEKISPSIMTHVALFNASRRLSLALPF